MKYAENHNEKFKEKFQGKLKPVNISPHVYENPITNSFPD
jgi:hypothetical protein